MVNEITIVEVWIIGVALFITLLLMAIMFAYFSVKDKIHDSYHEGYNEAKTDKINYYQTINDLEIHFNELFTELKQQNIPLDISTSCLLVNYKEKLREYKNKY